MHAISRHRRSLAASALAVALLGGACASGSSDQTGTSKSSATTISNSDAESRQTALGSSMRKLWEDHVTWTRLFIISAEAGSPDTDATAKRLLQNQVDIGDAIKPLYGDAAGTQLTALLRAHILTAGDLIAAAKAGDTAKVATTKARWYTNADQIADFLAKANPTNWPAGEMRQMMREHLDDTLAEAVDHLKGNFAADVADYDKVHVQILSMADMLTAGIVAQFPKQFS
jgi:hypothetical protein